MPRTIQILYFIYLKVLKKNYKELAGSRVGSFILFIFKFKLYFYIIKNILSM